MLKRTAKVVHQATLNIIAIWFAFLILEFFGVIYIENLFTAVSVLIINILGAIVIIFIRDDSNITISWQEIFLFFFCIGMYGLSTLYSIQDLVSFPLILDKCTSFLGRQYLGLISCVSYLGFYIIISSGVIINASKPK